MSIRETEHADGGSLQQNCLSGNTLEQVRTGIELAKAESARGEVAVLVAVDGTEVAGCIQVSRNPHRLKRHRAELSDFVIDPRARGHGLARRLTMAAATWAKARAAGSWRSTPGETRTPRVAYRALGFTEHGRLPGGIDEYGTMYDQVSFSLTITTWLERQPGQPHNRGRDSARRP